MEEIAMVLNRFGDEQSTLMDKFERLTFEVQLNQAILGRSLSEPTTLRPLPSHAIARDDRQPREGRRRRPGGIGKVLKKLLRPFLLRGGRRSNGKNKKGAAEAALDDYPTSNNLNPIPVPVYSKAFSRSLRL
ncbi:hypothetical protein SAY87_014776 [Trapa incisa]|uniref:Uncharacterized protein n=2 Tax=Trapa TaxID=22665 RepID=A0AAN7MCV8_TRANT|nr:hypothetical protein SAY87_014776 [Trapa incisa]KAK4802784.1 hypothetical protein SAY86_000987 [Trapa natans]